MRLTMKDERRRRFVAFFEQRYRGDRSRLIQDTGLTKGRIAQLFDANQPFGETASRRLAEALGLPGDYFERDHTGSHSTTAAEPSSAHIRTSNVEVGPASRGLVPLISWVQAGAWADVCDVAELSDVDRWLECPVPHSTCTAALLVRGDSMTSPLGSLKTYPDGCIIFVDFLRRSPDNGQRIVARLDGPGGGVTFKSYKDEDGRRWLQPLNPMHPPIFDPFVVLGTVIGKWEYE